MSLLHRLRKKLLLAVILGAAVFLGISIYTGFDKFTRSLANFNLWYLPLVIVLVVLNYILRFCKWHYY
ncbi:MAG: UPF0104 family protein, partial [Candidatus Coatesbacteria bacterium]|nr:UPF0104 family protein [Candidatus Coatesbacteria bacterium]